MFHYRNFDIIARSVFAILPARRSASVGISRRRVSVCLYVTRRYCIKTARRGITQTKLSYSQGTLVF